MALFVALVAAVFPPFILYATRSWLAETVFTTLILMGFWISLLDFGFWSGLIWGISSLFRAPASLLALGYPLANIKHYRLSALFLLGFIPLPVSFFLLNYFSGRESLPYDAYAKTGMVEAIKWANGPCAEGTQVYAGLIEAPEGADCNDILWRLKRPHTIPVLMLKKAGYLTLPYRAVKLREIALGPWPSKMLTLFFVVVPDALFFFLGGFYLTFIGIRRRKTFPMSWAWLSTLGLALLFLAVPRHLFPITPIFILGTFLLLYEKPPVRWWMLVSWSVFLILLVFAWIFWCIPFYAHHPLR
ncbi:MAG: hypothetical protein ACP5QG_05895 [candidate division WOR-3 bacterium]